MMFMIYQNVTWIPESYTYFDPEQETSRGENELLHIGLHSKSVFSSYKCDLPFRIFFKKE